VPRGYDGWPVVVSMLRKRDDEPVVTSYSVCEGFPNHNMVQDAGLIELPFYKDSDGKEYEDEYDTEPWDALSAGERWDLGMQALRGGEDDTWLELEPERWEYPDYHFGDNPLTGYQIYAGALEKKDRDPAVCQAREQRNRRF
jgi:hypothetical protein